LRWVLPVIRRLLRMDLTLWPAAPGGLGQIRKSCNPRLRAWRDGRRYLVGGRLSLSECLRGMPWRRGSAARIRRPAPSFAEMPPEVQPWAPKSRGTTGRPVRAPDLPRPPRKPRRARRNRGVEAARDRRDACGARPVGRRRVNSLCRFAMLALRPVGLIAPEHLERAGRDRRPAGDPDRPDRHPRLPLTARPWARDFEAGPAA